MAESKGRPGSASQRPTGGDKAVATQKKQYFRRKKVCRFCVEKIDDINYKDVKMLRSEEHTSELQSLRHLVCRLLLEKKNEWQKWMNAGLSSPAPLAALSFPAEA